MTDHDGRLKAHRLRNLADGIGDGRLASIIREEFAGYPEIDADQIAQYANRHAGYFETRLRDAADAMEGRAC